MVENNRFAATAFDESARRNFAVTKPLTWIRKGNIMIKKTNCIPAGTALIAAVEEADITLEELCLLDIQYEDDNHLYSIAFRGDWMSYLCYIDAFTGEILGFLSEPLEL